MSEWITTFDGTFFITITTILIGFLGLSVKYCLKSKCSKFKCCFGLIDIDRTVELENDIENNISNNNENNSIRTDEVVIEPQME